MSSSYPDDEAVDPLWRRYVAAESEYLRARVELFAGDPLPALKAALDSTDFRSALRILEEVGPGRPDLVLGVVPELFSHALGVTPDCTTARRILATLPPHVLAPRLPALVEQFLNGPANDYEEYRGLALLLDDLKLHALLSKVLDAAANSANPDLRDVAEEFSDGKQS